VRSSNPSRSGSGVIIDAFQDAGIGVDELMIVCGLLCNDFIIQVYADSPGGC
jgi:ribulose kinase